ncbi:RluA family pseudouridine synthase [Gracilibacillus kekensis]|uniref:Pseudouridine synthase n=1 Tax=Gracilibacillus kekensis TaxID=1027249 RepID=A0A1M7N3M3_9BACI|nr:RluA family pseudouridine synthase [Gracilibacillus kekensis]SHM98138.1 23S rRNA pseudouridine1911/1915/1917 synthase [Gracilibacillus kekensis]
MKTNRQNSNMEEYKVEKTTELLPFLLETFSNRSRNAVKSILTRGQVYVNNQEITEHNYTLQPGYSVTVQKNKAAKAATFEKMKILYEDDAIIVIEKDSGLLSIATEKERSLTAYKQLMEYVQQSNPNDRIFVVHRLDRETSGVMLFAKSEKIKKILQEGWSEMVQERSYVALVEGIVKKSEDTITSWLKETKTFKMYSSKKAGDGKKAITHYKVIKANNNLSLLSVYLETGRKNQIRVHMSDIGHPIVGDKKYGAKANSIGRFGLHAIVLAIKHPVTSELLRFKSNIPTEFLKKK